MAGRFRKEFLAGWISNTIGPRELVNAARIGKVKGDDYHTVLTLAFTNSLSTLERDTVDGMAHRIFS